MVLKLDWSLGRVGRVLGELLVPGFTNERRVILNNDSVVKDGGVCGTQFSAFKARAGEDDVVSLPFAGRAAGVHKRRRLPIQRSGLAVWVGLVPKTVQHLDLVAAEDEHTAVSSSLSGALGRRWSGPLDVQLYVWPELVGRFEVTAALHGDRCPFLDRPVRFAVRIFFELGEILAIEKHDCIAWSVSWF